MPQRRPRFPLAIVLLALLASARAGAQAFGPPNNVSQSASGSYVPSATIDRGGPEAGTLRLFWHDFTSSPNRIWCTDDSSGALAPGAPCEPHVTASWTPRAATDPFGVTHLVWRDSTAGVEDIWHATYDGTSWSAPVNVSNTPAQSRNPAIALDPWTRPHVLWEEGPGGSVRFFESHFDGTAWSAARDTGLPFAAAAFQDTLRLACDGAGTLHATWQDGATSLTEIHHAERPDGGTWSARENVSSSAGYSTEPAIAIASNDEIVLAWVEQDPASGAFAEICMSTRPAGGSWTPRQEITQLRQDAWRPAIAVGLDDVARIAFSSGPPGGREIVYLGSPTSSPVVVSASPSVDSDRASLVLDDQDRPTVAWQEGSPPTPEIHVALPVDPASPILLMVTRSGADVVLTWTGGAAPWNVARADAPDAAPPWSDVTPVGGIRAPSWIDAGVVGDGRLLCYDVR